MARPIHVLVVDDSAVVRQVMSELLGQEPDLTVAVASDPLIAFRKMGEARPDVVVLDLELPRMDGLTFLRKIMASDPTAVVICSGHTGDRLGAGIRALEEGAVEVIARPQIGVREFLYDSAVRIVDAVRAAAEASLPRRPSAVEAPPRLGSKIARAPLSLRSPEPKVVVLGASTGGTEALRQILAALPEDAPGIVVVQHMPEGYTAAFARRLDELCAVRVKEAAPGDEVRPGVALIAPGDRHVVLRRSTHGIAVDVVGGPLVSRHRPSVDVLFHSAVEAAGTLATGVLLTGMGDDGAEGLLAMRRTGARTIAQDEASCVVFGMPKEAIRRGAAGEVLPLESIAAALLRDH
jgi:two-component system chemotaxis response regulator CheB